MPVVLSCTHRFCHGCISEAALHDCRCPLCKKETGLDPAAYEIDPILNRFLKCHFRGSPMPSTYDRPKPRLTLPNPACTHTQRETLARSHWPRPPRPNLTLTFTPTLAVTLTQVVEPERMPRAGSAALRRHRMRTRERW